VKADAYGLGAEPVAKALAKGGCTRFYVAWPHEGGALRRALGAAPEILVFHGPTPDTLDIFQMYQLQPVLNHLEQIDLWVSANVSARPAAIHVDTGMNRLGLSEAHWAAAAKMLPKPMRLVSHLACGDEPDAEKNKAQLEAFERASKLWPGAPRSLAATGGVYLGSAYHFDEVRPGIGLYGGGPTPAEGSAPNTVVTLTAPVLQVRDIRKGETVGYGATFTAQADMTIATVGLGYADGFIRAASTRGKAFVGGMKKPIIGRISMDLIVLDVTGLNAAVGDKAEFLGENMPLSEQAEAMGTIDYEILTRLGSRLERSYSGGE
jgi:alanine racemase